MKNIPVSPASGGRSIGLASLMPCDIILVSGKGVSSIGIQMATSSPVSHAILYIGHGEVIDAIPNGGVVQRTLKEALTDEQGVYTSNFAVVLRYRGLQLSQANGIIHTAKNWLGSKYDYGKAVSSGVRRDPTICVLLTGSLVTCTGLALVDIPGRFQCAELVLKAYSQNGLPIVGDYSYAPQDLVIAYERGNLEYVGHLLT